jgi:hypothetical protein
VLSGLSVSDRPDRSGNVYISRRTTSVVSPTPLVKSSVASKMGVAICRYPKLLATRIPTSVARAMAARRSGRRSSVPRGREIGDIEEAV